MAGVPPDLEDATDVPGPFSFPPTPRSFDADDYTMTQFCALIVRNVYDASALSHAVEAFPNTFDRAEFVKSPVGGDDALPAAIVGVHASSSDTDLRETLVVVAFRGTSDFSDAVYDAQMEPTTNPWTNDAQDGFVHAGFMRYYAKDTQVVTAWRSVAGVFAVALPVVLLLAYGIVRASPKTTRVAPEWAFPVALGVVLLILWGGLALYAAASQAQSTPAPTLAANVRRVVGQYQGGAGDAATSTRVVLTGHSLGAALATLCAADLALQYAEDSTVRIDAYVFAPPRVGDAYFNYWLSRRERLSITALVHPEDLVSMVPPPPYTVCGFLVVLNAQSSGYRVDEAHYFWDSLLACAGDAGPGAPLTFFDVGRRAWWRNRQKSAATCRNGGFLFLPLAMDNDAVRDDESWKSFLKPVGWRLQHTGGTDALKRDPKAHPTSTSPSWDFVFDTTLRSLVAMGVVPLPFFLAASLDAFRAYDSRSATAPAPWAARCSTAASFLVRDLTCAAALPAAAILVWSSASREETGGFDVVS